MQTPFSTSLTLYTFVLSFLVLDFAGHFLLYILCVLGLRPLRSFIVLLHLFGKNIYIYIYIFSYNKDGLSLEMF
jgi:hypothetical protein